MAFNIADLSGRVSQAYHRYVVNLSLGQRTRQLLPPGSALVVSLPGLGIVLRGLLAYLARSGTR